MPDKTMKKFKLRCYSCSSRLIKVVIIPEAKHADIYCGVCDEFICHLWYTELLDYNDTDLHKELVGL